MTCSELRVFWCHKFATLFLVSNFDLNKAILCKILYIAVFRLLCVGLDFWKSVEGEFEFSVTIVLSLYKYIRF